MQEEVAATKVLFAAVARGRLLRQNCSENVEGLYMANQPDRPAVTGSSDCSSL